MFYDQRNMVCTALYNQAFNEIKVYLKVFFLLKTYFVAPHDLNRFKIGVPETYFRKNMSPTM